MMFVLEVCFDRTLSLHQISRRSMDIIDGFGIVLASRLVKNSLLLPQRPTTSFVPHPSLVLALSKNATGTMKQCDDAGLSTFTSQQDLMQRSICRCSVCRQVPQTKSVFLDHSE